MGVRRLVFKRDKDKRGLSEIVSYVLMISLAVLMSGMVFSWLKFYVSKPLPEESCPEVSLTVEEYACDADKNLMNLTVRNRGRFYVDGYILKVHDGTRFYSLVDVGTQKGVPYTHVKDTLYPTNMSTKTFNYAPYNRVNELEITAFRKYDDLGRPILCQDSTARYPVSGCN